MNAPEKFREKLTPHIKECIELWGQSPPEAVVMVSQVGMEIHIGTILPNHAAALLADSFGPDPHIAKCAERIQTKPPDGCFWLFGAFEVSEKNYASGVILVNYANYYKKLN